MKKTIIGLAIFILVLVSSESIYADEIVPNIGLYECRPTDKPPLIDGRLADECWKTAKEVAIFYKYIAGDTPAFPTSFRMLYDADGIYLGITMYEGFNEPEKFRASHTGRDNPELWKDDCAEIYFDPTGTVTVKTYFKFITNFLGTRTDLKRTSSGDDMSWSSEAWKVACSREEKDWFMECFFSWKDFETKPNPGDIWRFGLVRFTYATGTTGQWSFGTCWPEGARYNNPDGFGFLYFAKSTKGENIFSILPVLKKHIDGDWVLHNVEGMYIYSGSGKLEFIKFNDQIKTLKKSVSKLISEVEQLIKATEDQMIKKESQEKLYEIKKQLSAVPDKIDTSPQFNKIAEDIKKIKELAKELKYRLLLYEMMH